MLRPWFRYCTPWNELLKACGIETRSDVNVAMSGFLNAQESGAVSNNKIREMGKKRVGERERERPVCKSSKSV